MTTQTNTNLWKSELFAVLDETFERVQGIYLDKGTSPIVVHTAYHLGEIRQALSVLRG